MWTAPFLYSWRQLDELPKELEGATATAAGADAQRWNLFWHLLSGKELVLPSSAALGPDTALRQLPKIVTSNKDQQQALSASIKNMGNTIHSVLSR